MPHNLIEAFKSTLAELQYADLLLQVIDISDKNWKTHIKVVDEVLEELGVRNKPMLYVFNKADKISPDQNMIDSEIDEFQPHVIISANDKEKIKPLVDFLAEWHEK